MIINNLYRTAKVVKSSKKPKEYFNKISGSKKKFNDALKEVEGIGEAKGDEVQVAFISGWKINPVQRKVLSTAKREQKELYKKATKFLGGKPDNFKFDYSFSSDRRSKIVNAGQLGRSISEDLIDGMKSKSAYETRKYGFRLLDQNHELSKLLKEK